MTQPLPAIPRSRGQLRAWLDRYREWLLKLIEFDGYPRSSIPEMVVTIGSPSDRVCAEVLRRSTLWERLGGMRRGFEALKPAHRLLLKMRYLECLSISGICRETRLSRPTVHRLIREGFEALWVVVSVAERGPEQPVSYGDVVETIPSTYIVAGDHECGTLVPLSKQPCGN